MLYDLGRLDDYVYIYNTDDSSCRLMHKCYVDECEESSYRGSLSPAKLKMLYPKFVNNRSGVLMDLFQYDVEFYGFGVVTFVASIGLINMTSKNVKHMILSKYYERFSYGDYMLLLMIRQISRLSYASAFASTPCLWDFVIDKNKYECIPFPLQMLEHVLKSHDFVYIDSLFNNVLFDSLRVYMNNRSWLVAKRDIKDLDIRWY